MEFKTRNYRYRGANPGKEQKQFWIWLLIALAFCAAITYLF